MEKHLIFHEDGFIEFLHREVSRAGPKYTDSCEISNDKSQKLASLWNSGNGFELKFYETGGKVSRKLILNYSEADFIYSMLRKASSNHPRMFEVKE